MIPYNRPYLSGKESENISQVFKSGHLHGNGTFTHKCHEVLQELTGAHKVLLTSSCTAALEMSALLLDIKAGDEVIMPSFTFVSTANAFVLRGAKPIFVDVESNTLNINPDQIELAITERTKAIVPVHYAGVGCDMQRILEIANKHTIPIIEDAAQGLMASVDGKALGGMGTFGTLSFHSTKNISSGEGGALLINDESFSERAQEVWEKGTNRKKFTMGLEDKYTWTDLGSSFLPSDLTAAYLCAQLGCADYITKKRLSIWHYYHEKMAMLERQGFLTRPYVPAGCQHNGHIYFLLLEDLQTRNKFIEHMASAGIQTPFHYVPLHSSPMGSKCGQSFGSLPVTDSVSARIARLPVYPDLSELDKVIAQVYGFFGVTEDYV